MIRANQQNPELYTICYLAGEPTEPKLIACKTKYKKQDSKVSEKLGEFNYIVQLCTIFLQSNMYVSKHQTKWLFGKINNKKENT